MSGSSLQNVRASFSLRLKNVQAKKSKIDSLYMTSPTRNLTRLLRIVEVAHSTPVASCNETYLGRTVPKATLKSQWLYTYISKQARLDCLETAECLITSVPALVILEVCRRRAVLAAATSQVLDQGEEGRAGRRCLDVQTFHRTRVCKVALIFRGRNPGNTSCSSNRRWCVVSHTTTRRTGIGFMDCRHCVNGIQ